MKPLFLVLLYLLAVLAPLILSWKFGGEPRPFRHELASGIGMLAFSMILAEFVLSGRFKRISNGIGMDLTMRFHQIMARTALGFALLHPFLYTGAPSGGTRPWDTTRQLTITTDFSDLATGIAAFVLLPGLVLLAVGRTQLDYKYETWRLMHGIGALLIAFLLLHHATYAGRYGALPVMAWFWLAMTGIAVGSLLHVYLIAPLRQRAKRWRVASIARLSPKQWGLTLAPDGHAGMDYKAGQFVWLNVGHSPYSLHVNPFSISSAPASGPDVSFIIKELGDFTGTLDQITPGTRAYLDGPYGSLTVEGRTEPGIVLVAGGVGIAPLLGILRQMRLTGDPRKIRLVYGNRRQEQIICRKELDGQEVTYVLSEPPQNWEGETGVIDAMLLDRILTPEQFRQWLFVLCGPAIMMDVVEEHLIARGTPSNRILSERFDYD
ncbi:ferredoxin reductase family protein [Pseudogemmobacter sp. W21_MBD1_M6]|uniref:ferredoxin reductase family protein n=1 Tax=Pseudogemmobacter sp. W21_MBD1_M6 TaxID=3240271 RepID=UPI003F9E523C